MCIEHADRIRSTVDGMVESLIEIEAEAAYVREQTESEEIAVRMRMVEANASMNTLYLDWILEEFVDDEADLGGRDEY